MKTWLKRILLRHHRRANPSPNLSASEFEVDNWIISNFVVDKLVPVVGCHPYPLDELMLMAGAICRFKPAYIFDWGTNIGTSARIFYETATYFSVPSEIYSIDLPDHSGHSEHPGKARGKLVKGKKGVHLHIGDGVETALSILRGLPAAGRVLFFVDGDHSYESVARELGLIIEKVEDPIVIVHDTFYQSGESGYNIGPHRAICDALRGGKLDGGFNVLETKMGLPGMTMLY